jgi:putative DNA primase/helicase
MSNKTDELARELLAEGPYEATELGNAKRYVARFGKKWKFVVEKGEWLRWDGTRWTWDIVGEHVRNVQAVLAEIKAEAEVRQAMLAEYLQVTKADGDDPVLKEARAMIRELQNWYKRSQTGARLREVPRIAAAEAEMAVSISEIDSKGHYLGVQNGVLDLRVLKWKFIHDDPAYLMTKSSRAAYLEEAPCPRWEAFVDTIMCGDRQKVEFLQRVVGQAMLGIPGKDKLVIFYGQGANGKSTFIDTIARVLGDYAATTDPRILATNPSLANTKHEYYMAGLKDVRLVLMNEAGDGSHLAEDLVKQIVDSGQISARHPAGRPFQYQPVMTPILSTNHKPNVGDDYAIWRRILMVPFDYRIPEQERNPKFRQEVLEPELSGILNWCLEGCVMYQRDGLAPPEAILEATEQYRREQDKLGQFLLERVTAGEPNGVRLSDLMEVWQEWCRSAGVAPYGAKKMKDKLKAREYDVELGPGHQNWVRGVAMVDNVISMEVAREKRQQF